MTGTLWRRVAAAVSHVPGVEAEMFLADGTTCWVGEDAREGEGPTVDVVRTLVVEALEGGTVAHPQLRLPDAHGDRLDVTRVRLRGTLTQAIERGARWRHTCSCRMTDYLLTEIEVDDALALGHALLSEILASGRSFWARRDAALGVTVLAFDWPPDLSDDQRSSVEQALRDLSVMCRIRASIDEL